MNEKRQSVPTCVSTSFKKRCCKACCALGLSPSVSKWGIGRRHGVWHPELKRERYGLRAFHLYSDNFIEIIFDSGVQLKDKSLLL